jgi:hypothetical protein
MFFKSLLYPKIKRNDNNYISNIKLDKIVVISIDENVDFNNFYEKRKQNSPYNNKNIEKEYLLEICDKV